MQARYAGYANVKLFYMEVRLGRLACTLCAGQRAAEAESAHAACMLRASDQFGMDAVLLCHEHRHCLFCSRCPRCNYAPRTCLLAARRGCGTRRPWWCMLLAIRWGTGSSCHGMRWRCRYPATRTSRIPPAARRSSWWVLQVECM